MCSVAYETRLTVGPRTGSVPAPAWRRASRPGDVGEGEMLALGSSFAEPTEGVAIAAGSRLNLTDPPRLRRPAVQIS
jgi:hypothetical protein